MLGRLQSVASSIRGVAGAADLRVGVRQGYLQAESFAYQADTTDNRTRCP
jgi:hypothetical protein